MLAEFKKVRIPKAVYIRYEDQMLWGPGLLETHIERIIKDKTILARAVRYAMLETLIPKLREAWLLGLTKAVNMQVISDSSPESQATGRESIISNPRAHPTLESETLNRIFERMRAANMRGDQAAHERATQEYVKHEEAYLKSLQQLAKGGEKRSHYLSSGLFRRRALEVMHTMLQEPKITSTPEGLNVGIGNLAELEAIKTPSATEYVLHRGRTGSKFDVLWRHLEFGTGVYSDVQRETSKWNEGFTGGQWYYGQHRARARLLLQGSEGVHSLKAIGGMEAHPDFVNAVEKYLTKVLTPGAVG